MKMKMVVPAACLIALALPAQEAQEAGFGKAAASIQTQLQESLQELAQLREGIAEEKIRLSKKLSSIESRMISARMEFEEKARLVDSTTLDLETLRQQIKSRKEETSYLANLMSEYLRNFEARIHVSELQRYGKQIETAKLAAENLTLTDAEIFRAQAAIIQTSLDRVDGDLGGEIFRGSAIDSVGLVSKGTFALLGPIALFRSSDGKEVGLAEQRLGSTEPTLIPFADPDDALAAAKLVETGSGQMPVDPTLGNAYMVESTEETFLEQVQKGGPVMVPIFVMAAAALLVALWRWLVLLSIRKPARSNVEDMLGAVRSMDRVRMEESLRGIRGPTREMLEAGVAHIDEPREIIEEVMYEKCLKTRLGVQRFLPFIAISAASAPLLGLLGTVTGIINTFKLITIHGSGDVKMLSGGISEALITTKFGLVVAIPSLLIHAYLSRKAKGIVGDMERTAIRFTNELSHARPTQGQGTAEDRGHDVLVPTESQPDVVRDQVREILGEILGPPAQRQLRGGAGAKPRRLIRRSMTMTIQGAELPPSPGLWQEALQIWAQGGWAMWAIAVIALVIFGMGMHIHLRLREKGFRVTHESTWRRWIDHPRERSGNIGRLLSVMTSGRDVVETKHICDQVVESETTSLERDLKVMRICVSAAPLVGLLGTVTGMLATFGALGSGSGGDKTMALVASGISEALITTETGLVIALPGLFFQYKLQRSFEQYRAFLAHVETVCTQAIHKRHKRLRRLRIDRAARDQITMALRRAVS